MDQITINGMTINLVTDTNFEMHLREKMRVVFDAYLKEKFGIHEDQLLKILKQAGPEEFI